MSDFALWISIVASLVSGIGTIYAVTRQKPDYVLVYVRPGEEVRLPNGTGLQTETVEPPTTRVSDRPAEPQVPLEESLPEPAPPVESHPMPTAEPGLQRVLVESSGVIEPAMEDLLRQTESSVSYVGLRRRAVAFTIDSLIIFALQFGLIAASAASDAGWVFNVFYWTSASVGALYFTVSWGRWGKTVGYRVLGVRLVRQDFHEVTYLRAFVRYLATYLAIYTVVGFMMIVFTKKRRGLWDYMTDTVVIRGRALRP